MITFLLSFFFRRLLTLVKHWRNRPVGWWVARMRARQKPRDLAEFLAKHMGASLSHELKMIYWRSYRLRGFADEIRQPDINVGLCILFGDVVTQRRLQFFEHLNADRVGLFIDRTTAHDAAARMGRMKLSPRLRYVVLTEQELGAQLAIAKSPAEHLSSMIKLAAARG